MKKTRSLFVSLVLLLPAMLSLFVLGATSSAVDNVDKINAAIVNLDEPATLSSGQTFPGGRQMIASLTGPSPDIDLAWEVVSESTAAKGLADGRYEAVVTIPQDFSAKVVGVLEGNSTDTPTVQVVTASSSSVAGQVSTAVARSATTRLGTNLTVMYLNASLSATEELTGGLRTAASGATQLADGSALLADGTSQLASGSDELASGLSSLADGSSQLASGSQNLSSGLGQYRGGVSQAASGASQLASGSSALSSGVAQYTGGVSQLAWGADQLASGSSGLAQGVRAYTDGVQAVHDGLTKPQAGSPLSLVDGSRQVSEGLMQLDARLASIDTTGLESLPASLSSAADAAGDLKSGAGQLQLLIQACAAGNADACAGAEQAAAALENGAGQLQSELNAGASSASASTGQLTMLGELRAAVGQLSSGAQGVSNGVSTLASSIESQLLGPTATQLNDGATQVSSGAAQLSDGLARAHTSSADLASGAASLDSGTRDLSSGLATLDSRGGDLASGAEQVSSGAAQLNEGASSAASGASELASGAARLDLGARPLASGADSLASGLSDAVDQIPATGDPAARAAAIGAPVDLATASGRDTTSRTDMAGVAAAIALWIGALMAVMALGKMKRARLFEAATPLRLARESVVPSLTLAAVQALLVAIVLRLAGVSVARPIPAFLFVVGAAIAFTVTNDALMAIFARRGGVIASVSLLTIQAIAIPMVLPAVTQNDAISFVRSITPVPQAAEALTSLITGSAGSLGTAISVIVAWAILGFGLSVVGVRKRRSTNVTAIRSELAHA